MTPADLRAHVRRYPRWYAVALVWLLGMVALPIVQADPLDVFRPDAGTPSAVAPTSTPGALPDVAPTGPAAPGVPGATTDTTEASTGAPQDEAVEEDEPSALELVPPELLDLIFDSLPPVVAPPLPDDLAPLLQAVAPVASFGCTGLGLASVVLAVAAQSVEGVPFSRLLPYLAPVVTACAAFPIPATHTVCAADEPLITDLAGVATTPPILGLGIDQLEAVEHVLSSTFGQSLPSVAAGLRTTLDCELVTT